VSTERTHRGQRLHTTSSWVSSRIHISPLPVHTHERTHRGHEVCAGSTCYIICLGRTKTLTIRLFLSTLTSGMPFRKCAVRLPLTHPLVSLRRPTTVGGCNLVTRSPPLTRSSLSWVTSGQCTTPSAPIGLLTTVFFGASGVVRSINKPHTLVFIIIIASLAGFRTFGFVGASGVVLSINKPPTLKH
jgi:hypothetical protein